MTGRRHCKALLVNGIFGHTCSQRKKKNHHLCGRLPGRSHERREAAVEPRFLTAPRPLPHGLITAKNTILPLRHQGKKTRLPPSAADTRPHFYFNGSTAWKGCVKVIPVSVNRGEPAAIGMAQYVQIREA